MAAKKYRRIVVDHMPSDWKLVEREAIVGSDGFCSAKQIITCKPIVCRHSLMVFLHECGHIWSDHFSLVKTPRWLEEHEANQYALKAMRSHSIPILRSTDQWWRQALRENIEYANEHGDHVDNEEALKYAYGRNWRAHR